MPDWEEVSLSLRGGIEMRSKDENVISTFGTALGMLLIAVVVIMLNFFPHNVGYYRSLIDPSDFVPISSAAVGEYLPWLNLWLGPRFALNMYNLWRPSWVPLTHWFGLALDVIGAVICGSMVSGQELASTFDADLAFKLLAGILSVGLMVNALKHLQVMLGEVQAFTRGRLA